MELVYSSTSLETHPFTLYDSMMMLYHVVNVDFQDATQEELDAHAFDRFKVQLTNIQAILASREDDWQAERKGGFGKLHLLQPVTLAVDFMKSIVPDDIRLPKFVHQQVLL